MKSISYNFSKPVDFGIGSPLGLINLATVDLVLLGNSNMINEGGISLEIAHISVHSCISFSANEIERFITIGGSWDYIP